MAIEAQQQLNGDDGCDGNGSSRPGTGIDPGHTHPEEDNVHLQRINDLVAEATAVSNAADEARKQIIREHEQEVRWGRVGVRAGVRGWLTAQGGREAVQETAYIPCYHKFEWRLDLGHARFPVVPGLVGKREWVMGCLVWCAYTLRSGRVALMGYLQWAIGTQGRLLHVLTNRVLLHHCCTCTD